MKVYYFSEFPYHAYPDEEGDKFPSLRLTFPNTYFEPETASDLFKRYFDECVYVDEMGFDGIMVNEHHNTPSCMNASCNLSAAVLARTTKQAKILLLGNILPIHDNPVRLAEEIAMIDVISGGRVISGMVRGTGVETLATNGNPMYNRERFEECHDLLIKTWTTPAPSAGRASTTTSGWSIPGWCRCRNPIRRSGCPAPPARRRRSGPPNTAIPTWLS